LAKNLLERLFLLGSGQNEHAPLIRGGSLGGNVRSATTQLPKLRSSALTLWILGGVLLVAEPPLISTPPSPESQFNRITLPAGPGPGFIAIADVNHDGKPDIIVANEDDGTLAVLLGDGKGHFSQASGSPFQCGPNPNDIAVADMNGDGNPDLVIANTQTPYITILLGDGHGSFKPSPHSPFATQSRPHPHGVAVGDFMGDGKPAVVTDSWGTDQILLIPSDGRGNLILPGKFFHADLHSDAGVHAADFNKDGKLDIVTTSQSADAVGLMLGDGRGGFRKAPGSPFLAGDTSWIFTVGDINGDGNPDVAVIPYERDMHDHTKLGVTVLLGDGKGGLTTMRGSPFSLAGCRGPARISLGDVNGDGLSDIVVSCAQNNKLMLFLGARNGGFERSSLDVPTGWSGLAIADLNGDGKDDIVLSNNPPGAAKFQNGTVTVFMSR
jgi:hypothetical protein